MISYIKGSLEQVKNTEIILETGGIGYRMIVSAATVAILPALGNVVKIYTYMHVKEDGISLYGFASQEECELFYKLISVSGIGPKGALGLLSSMKPAELILAIISEDVRTLSKGPGIGKKTAGRLILELKDKLRTEDAIAECGSDISLLQGVGAVDVKKEAMEALLALGYSKSEAIKAIGKVKIDGLTTEEILKTALKEFVKP